MHNNSVKKQILDKRVTHYIFLFIYSFMAKFFHSFNSPRFDDFSIYSDNAIFYSIGRAILDGKVLYKDVFDHKTPYIYFINAFAAILPWQHIGLYIIESIVLFISLLFTYKIILLCISDNFKSKEYIALCGSAFICFLLNNVNITLGVTRTEAYAVACMLPAAYLFIKFLIVAESNKEKEFSIKDMFVIGMLASFSFMTNIRAIILFVPYGMAIAIVLILHKKYVNLIKVVLAGIFGVIIIILPYVIYMLLTNSMKDMIYAVFHINAVYADNDAIIGGVSRNIIEMVVRQITHHPILFILILLNFVSILMIKIRSLKISTLFSYVICFLYIVLSNRLSTYYYVVLIPFMIALFLFIINIINMLHCCDKRDGRVITIILIIILFILNFSVGFNLVNIRYTRDGRIASEIREKVIKYRGTLDNTKILALGFNPEMYTYLGSKLDYKFFIVPDIKYSVEKKPYEEQYRYIIGKSPEVVIFIPDRFSEEFPIPMMTEIKKILSTDYIYAGEIETEDSAENNRVFIRKW